MGPRRHVVSAMTLTRIRGRILSDTPDVTMPGALIRVSVEDVSREDVSAPVIAAEDFPARGGGRVVGTFDFSVDVSPAGTCAVRIHVDQNGDGETKVGDLVSFARHTVSAPASATESPLSWKFP